MAVKGDGGSFAVFFRCQLGAFPQQGLVAQMHAVEKSYCYAIISQNMRFYEEKLYLCNISQREEVEIRYGEPLYVMAKPVGAVCNLRCSYCYANKIFTPATTCNFALKMLSL